MLFLLDLHRDNRYTQLRLMEGREDLCVDRSCKCTYALLHPPPPSPKNLLSIALRYASLLLLLTPYRVRVCVCGIGDACEACFVGCCACDVSNAGERYNTIGIINFLHTK